MDLFKAMPGIHVKKGIGIWEVMFFSGPALIKETTQKIIRLGQWIKKREVTFEKIVLPNIFCNFRQSLMFLICSRTNISSDNPRRNRNKCGINRYFPPFYVVNTTLCFQTLQCKMEKPKSPEVPRHFKLLSNTDIQFNLKQEIIFCVGIRFQPDTFFSNKIKT